MKVELEKTDLVNLVSSTQPYDRQECDNYSKQGLMTFTGNQHNESWTWDKDELMKLSERTLLNLYNKHND